jgi:hypothetical protein
MSATPPAAGRDRSAHANVCEDKSAVGYISIVNYNVWSCTNNDRLDDILSELSQHHVLVLIGTKRRAYGKEYTSWRRGQWTIYSFGYKPGGKFTNRTAGIIIAVRRDILPPALLRTVPPVPQQLAGRAASLHFKGSDVDLWIDAAYIPPDSGPHARLAAAAVYDHLQRVSNKRSGRCVEVLCMDANAHVGEVHRRMQPRQRRLQRRVAPNVCQIATQNLLQHLLALPSDMLRDPNFQRKQDRLHPQSGEGCASHQTSDSAYARW